jgi:electron transport complex protein RnfC
VILGGPMMGISIADLSCPITKTSGAITVLTTKDIGGAKIERCQTACIRCGRCIEACPMNLNPTKIAHAVKHDLFDLAQNYYLTACIECGCCSYVCPANIELTGYIRTGKVLLARAKKKVT